MTTLNEENKIYIKKLIITICRIMQEHSNDIGLSSQLLNLCEDFNYRNLYFMFVIFADNFTDTDFVDANEWLNFDFKEESVHISIKKNIDYYILFYKDIDKLPIMMQNLAHKLYDLVWSLWR